MWDLRPYGVQSSCGSRSCSSNAPSSSQWAGSCCMSSGNNEIYLHPHHHQCSSVSHLLTLKLSQAMCNEYLGQHHSRGQSQNHEVLLHSSTKTGSLLNIVVKGPVAAALSKVSQATDQAALQTLGLVRSTDIEKTAQLAGQQQMRCSDAPELRHQLWRRRCRDASPQHPPQGPSQLVHFQTPLRLARTYTGAAATST